MKPVIVYGNSALSKMLFCDAEGDPNFQIVAFTAQRQYITGPVLFGVPVIDACDIAALYPPDKFDMVLALGGYSDMRLRAQNYRDVKAMGYHLCNYLSRKADVMPGLQMGENNLVIGSAHIGMEGRMGNNNVIRQNVYLGHNFQLGDHNMISAGCTIGGYCSMGSACFVGLGATVINNVNVADETLIGAGSVVIRDTEPHSKVVGNPARVIGYHREEGIKMEVRHG